MYKTCIEFKEIVVVIVGHEQEESVRENKAQTSLGFCDTNGLPNLNLKTIPDSN